MNCSVINFALLSTIVQVYGSRGSLALTQFFSLHTTTRPEGPRSRACAIVALLHAGQNLVVVGQARSRPGGPCLSNVLASLMQSMT